MLIPVSPHLSHPLVLSARFPQLWGGWMIGRPCCRSSLLPWVQMCSAAAAPRSPHLLPRSAAVTLLLGKQARCPSFAQVLPSKGRWKGTVSSHPSSACKLPGRSLQVSATDWGPLPAQRCFQLDSPPGPHRSSGHPIKPGN